MGDGAASRSTAEAIDVGRTIGRGPAPHSTVQQEEAPGDGARPSPLEPSGAEQRTA